MNSILLNMQLSKLYKSLEKKNGIFSQIILFGESFLQKRIGMGVAKQNQINSFKSII